jgi:hypothetical protein
MFDYLTSLAWSLQLSMWRLNVLSHMQSQLMFITMEFCEGGCYFWALLWALQLNVVGSWTMLLSAAGEPIESKSYSDNGRQWWPTNTMVKLVNIELCTLFWA